MTAKGKKPHCSLHTRIAVRVPLPEGSTRRHDNPPNRPGAGMRKHVPPRRTQDLGGTGYTSRLERWPNRDRVVGEAWRLALFNAWFINGLLQPNATFELEKNPSMHAREDARPARSRR